MILYSERLKLSHKSIGYRSPRLNTKNVAKSRKSEKPNVKNVSKNVDCEMLKLRSNEPVNSRLEPLSNPIETVDAMHVEVRITIVAAEVLTGTVTLEMLVAATRDVALHLHHLMPNDAVSTIVIVNAAVTIDATIATLVPPLRHHDLEALSIENARALVLVRAQAAAAEAVVVAAVAAVAVVAVVEAVAVAAAAAAVVVEVVREVRAVRTADRVGEVVVRVVKVVKRTRTQSQLTVAPRNVQTVARMTRMVKMTLSNRHANNTPFSSIYSSFLLMNQHLKKNNFPPLIFLSLSLSLSLM